MQRFYPAVKALWVRCNVGYAYNVYSGVGQRFGSTSGGDYFEAKSLSPFANSTTPVLSDTLIIALFFIYVPLPVRYYAACFII